MSDQDAKTPRVFLLRHGETEWSKEGRFTGTSNIGLTTDGLAQVSQISSVIVGAGKLLDPSRLARIIVSPRERATKTLELFLPAAPVNSEVIEDVREWDYGKYEGLTEVEIRRQRKEEGLGDLNIWRDGCPGGESKQQITERLDRIIRQIRDMQKSCIEGKQPADVLLVAHGLILRCFWKRWVKLEVDHPIEMVLPPAGLAILSYRAGDIERPNFYVGMALPLVPTEKGI